MLTTWGLYLALPMGGTLFLDLGTLQFTCGSYFDILLSNHLVTRSMPIFMKSQMQMAGSETQRTAYFIGYLRNFAQAYIHPLSWPSLPHRTLDQLFLILMTLCLEPLGPKFSTVKTPRLSLQSGYCIWVYCYCFVLIVELLVSSSISGIIWYRWLWEWVSILRPMLDIYRDGLTGTSEA